MHVICVIDDGGGMLFNHRRQSQDRVLRQRILARANGHRLWMNAYSYGQFSEEAQQITVSERFLQEAQPGDYCFVEDQPLLPASDRIESVILYHWNRRYPSDFRLDLPLAAHGWEKIACAEFAGSSHTCITEEIYIRRTE